MTSLCFPGACCRIQTPHRRWDSTGMSGTLCSIPIRWRPISGSGRYGVHAIASGCCDSQQRGAAHAPTNDWVDDQTFRTTRTKRFDDWALQHPEPSQLAHLPLWKVSVLIPSLRHGHTHTVFMNMFHCDVFASTTHSEFQTRASSDCCGACPAFGEYISSEVLFLRTHPGLSSPLCSPWWEFITSPPPCIGRLAT